MTETKIAVILIRGRVGVTFDIKRTLDQLRLLRKYACVVLPKNDSVMGMLQKAKDYITWGEITPETEKLLIEKRGKKDEEGKLKPFYSLHPPRGGFEKKGTKKPYSLGGALGNRKTEMNKLIEKML